MTKAMQNYTVSNEYANVVSDANAPLKCNQCQRFYKKKLLFKQEQRKGLTIYKGGMNKYIL